MPTFTLPNPTGIDYYIQRQQTRLYDYLMAKWDIAAQDKPYNCFGRAYRNNLRDKATMQDNYIPEFYDPAQGKYVSSFGKENAGGLFYDDRLSVLSFYSMGDPEGKNAIRDEVAKVSLMFFLNLDRIKPAGMTVIQQAGQRLDEVVINDVKNFLECNGCCFTITNTFRNVDKVLEMWSGSAKKDALINDMQPKFCFRLDMEIRYNPQINIPIFYN
jgi:hypothetical protein